MVRPTKEEIDEMFKEVCNARVSDDSINIIDSLISIWMEGEKDNG